MDDVRGTEHIHLDRLPERKLGQGMMCYPWPAPLDVAGTGSARFRMHRVVPEAAGGYPAQLAISVVIPA